MSYPPQAVAMGDQMHAEMVASAKRTVAAILDGSLDGQGIVVTEQDQEYIDIGIATGVLAAMHTLAANGIIKIATPE